MKNTSFSHNRSLLVFVLASFVVTLFALAIPNGTVLATSLVEIPPETEDPPNVEEVPTPGTAFVEWLYQRESTFLERKGNEIDRADEFVINAEERIAELKEDGKDTESLENALDIFREQLSLSRQAYDQAAEVLNTHAGLDENGKVTDMQQARETVRDAGKSLRECHRILYQAVRDLRFAINEYRQSQQSGE